MLKLCFQFLNDPAKTVVARAYFNDTGNLQVESADKKFAEYITATIAKIKAENSTLGLRGGYVEDLPDGGQRSVSTLRQTIYGEPAYLAALWDYFNWHKDTATFNGRRFRAYTDEV